MIHVAGQIPRYPDGTVETGDMSAQANRTLDNIEAILAAGGSDFCHVMFVNLGLIDLAEFGAFNAEYLKRFEDCPDQNGLPYLPARYTVQVSAIPVSSAIKLEMSVIAAAYLIIPAK
jgi:2-iminobutanoate/2-iminopropanoate deaminase